jgi:predicted site-specific integrase-resolvase
MEQEKIKLSTWAKHNGVSYTTAYKLFRANKLPVDAIQLETGTILVSNVQNDTEQEKQALNDVLGIVKYFCVKLFGQIIGEKKYKQIENIIIG